MVAEYEHGKMDITGNQKTFEAFVRMSAWVCVLAIGVLIFLAIFNS